jgi:hypothetical protein
MPTYAELTAHDDAEAKRLAPLIVEAMQGDHTIDGFTFAGALYDVEGGALAVIAEHLPASVHDAIGRSIPCTEWRPLDVEADAILARSGGPDQIRPRPATYSIGQWLGALEALGCAPRPRGPSQWMTRCPAHHDESPSLSVGVGAGGRVLAHCFAGCSFEAVAAAVRDAV